MEQSSHLLLDGIQTDRSGRMSRNVGVLHLFVGEWSYILILAQVNTRWNILLPVGEGTVTLRNLVLPRVFEHFVEILEWVEASSLNIQMFSIDAQKYKTSQDYQNANYD